MVFRRRRRSVVRRRRTFRARSRRVRPRRMMVNRYDGECKQICKLAVNMGYVAANSRANLAIAWGHTGVSSATTVYPNAPPEFAAFAALFREWRMMYLRIKVSPVISYFPAQAGGTGPSSGLFQFSVGSGMGLASTSSNEALAQCPDYKTFGCDRAFSRGYKCFRFFNNHQEKWLSTAGDYNTEITTLITASVLGFADTATIGRVEISWYVKFRGRILA